MLVTTKVVAVVALVGGLAIGASAVALAGLPHLGSTAPSQTPTAQASPKAHASAKGEEATEVEQSPEPKETPEAKATPRTKATPRAGASGQSEQEQDQESGPND